MLEIWSNFLSRRNAVFFQKAIVGSKIKEDFKENYLKVESISNFLIFSS